MGEQSIIVRFAEDGDKEEVLAFTEKTWEWGDYIKYVWDEWLRDPSGKLFVAEVNNKPVGILHVKFLPDGCAWLEGLRIHPQFRRRGIASKLNLEVLEYIKEKKFNTVRLAITSWNVPSQRLAIKLGFKEISRWMEFEIKVNKIPKMEKEKCSFEESNIDFLWRKIIEAEPYTHSNGLIPVSWRWIKFSKEILNKFIKEKEIKPLLCNSDLLLYKVEPESKYHEIEFVTTTEPEILLKGLNYLVKVFSFRSDDFILILVPKGARLAQELQKKGIFETEELIVFEKVIK